jgi:hypothetical protein
VPKFDIYGQMDEMAIVYGNSIGVSFPDLIIPTRSPKCTFRNNTANESFTVYLLDPPGTYQLSSSGGSVAPTTYGLPAGRELVLPPGLYIVKSSNGGTVYPGQETGLFVERCGVMSNFGYYSPDDDVWETIADISPMFFAY